MVNYYHVKKIHHHKPIWAIPSDLMKQLGIKSHQIVLLKAGSLGVRVRVVNYHSPNQKMVFKMGLSKPALERLKLPADISLAVKSIGKKTYTLGPLIGIMTYMHTINKDKFALYKPYFNKLKGNGLLYVFGTANLHSKTKTVTGKRYDKKKHSWVASEFPFPDVVLDRVYPNNVKAQAVIEKMIGKGKLFNKHNLIDKMNFYKTISRSEYLNQFLPKTKLYEGPNDITDFLKTHDKVFLKPINGMMGQGIVLVSPVQKGLLCQYMKDKESTSKVIKDSTRITKILKEITKFETPYVIQGAIPRMEYRNSPCNFRFIVAKDGLGRWTVPAIFARVAKPGEFLTNSSLGAEIISLNELFTGIESKLPCCREALLASLFHLSILTAEELDKEYGPLGMMGLDLILDSKGKPWLIEANGNPGDMPVETLHEYPSWRYEMYEYPIAYALHLANYNQTNTPKKKRLKIKFRLPYLS